ncbi:MAG TPA: hypothetical protein VK308_12030 [Pyrinomonadaceae bacterium]|nr:hypothetical protein [Pyrinomonadaceae bacterium]
MTKILQTARLILGKGCAMETTEACLNYDFEKLGFREIIAITGLENGASRKFWRESVLFKEAPRISTMKKP